MSDLVTADGLSACTIQGLARLCGCHRDQIRLWRSEGAPTTLVLSEWHAWLESKRRWQFAEALKPCLLEPADGADAGSEPPPAPASDESKAEADLRYARLRADKMQRELDELDGRLIARTQLERAIGRLSALVVDRLQRGIWESLLPALDAASPDTRRGVREAHDRAILAMRGDLGASAVRRVLMEIMPGKDD